jgi:hypothetical protein
MPKDCPLPEIMNTPDTEEKAIYAKTNEGDTYTTPNVKNNYLDVSCQKCGHIPRGRKHLCDFDAAPDTEWREALHKLGDEFKLWASQEEELENLIVSIVSSRDTYWKERVRKEVEKEVRTIDTFSGAKVKAILKSDLDTLLDNLK